MLTMVRFLFAIIFTLTLSACGGVDQEDLYAYFLQHPLQLKNEIDSCHKTQDSSGRCGIALKAMEEVSALVADQHHDPQKFGEDILQLEMACSKTQDPAIREKIKVLLAVVSLSSPE